LSSHSGHQTHLASHRGKALSWEIRDGVLELALHLAPCNEIGTRMLGELEGFAVALEAAAEAGHAGALIVYSRQAAGFSAGADLRELYAGALPLAPAARVAGVRDFLERIHRVLNALDASPLTTIAAVHGVTFGGGFELALACDLIVASEEAKFGLPEVRRGLAAGAGGLTRLPRRIPYHVAMEIALTGEHFPAGRLHAAGLVNMIVPAGRALDGARELAGRVALGAPLSLAASKRVIAAAADWDSSEAFARQSEIIGPVFTSADAIEGATAFAEKRPPAWRGE